MEDSQHVAAANLEAEEEDTDALLEGPHTGLDGLGLTAVEGERTGSDSGHPSLEAWKAIAARSNLLEEVRCPLEDTEDVEAPWDLPFAPCSRVVVASDTRPEGWVTRGQETTEANGNGQGKDRRGVVD